MRSAPERGRRPVRRSSMRRLITAVLAAAVLALTGCGSDQDDSTGARDPHPTRTPEPTPSTEPSPTPPSPTPTSQPTPTSKPGPSEPPVSSSLVERVAMTQSGGIAGISRTWDVGPSDPGHVAVFAAASPKALAGAEGSTGKAPCCDLFQYRLTVSYSDGTSESFRFYDGAPADPAVSRLVRAVLKTQPQASDSPTLQ